MMLAPVSYFLPLTKIHRRLLLPGPVHLVVRKGQFVKAGDPIAIDPLSGGHLVLDIERGLGMAAEEANQNIQCRVGETVTVGDILAGPVGMTHRVVRAPSDGKIVWSGEGKIVLELEKEPIVLRASVPGEVEDLIPDRGATLVAYGGLAQGIWGNGRIASGELRLLVTEPCQPLTTDLMAHVLSGAIVVCGPCINATALNFAQDLKVGGLILSSIDPLLMDQAAKASIPIVLIEGFGRRPMNQVAYDLFSAFEGRQAALNAEPWNWFSGARPEVVFPAEVEDELYAPPRIELYRPGCRVRVLSSFYGSRTGRLVEQLGQVLLPNGLRSEAAVVNLESEETVTLPLANLEVLPEM
jgi:hypothetical protein